MFRSSAYRVAVLGQSAFRSGSPPSHRRLGLMVLTFTAAGLGACAVDTLPPPYPPPQLMPPLYMPLSVPPGTARVIIATDIDAYVDRRSNGAPSPSHDPELISSDTLCRTTPCVVTLPYADHQLEFSGVSQKNRTSTAQVSIRNDTVVVNHTLGLKKSSKFIYYGIVLILAGTLTLALSNAGPFEKSTEWKIVDYVAGGVQIGVGGLMIVFSRATVQEGSTTQWTPKMPETPKSNPGVSLRGEF